MARRSLKVLPFATLAVQGREPFACIASALFTTRHVRSTAQFTAGAVWDDECIVDADAMQQRA